MAEAVAIDPKIVAALAKRLGSMVIAPQWTCGSLSEVLGEHASELCIPDQTDDMLEALATELIISGLVRPEDVR
jgi:hypothetical protein